MALLQDILAWSKDELLPWQSDAVRRLFQKVTLDEQDFVELAHLLRAHNGLPVDGELAPVPLAQEHLPETDGAQAEPAVLNALHSLQHVNRLAAEQRLNFVSPGLTVIYGDNGAGKSGYSRVIKSACRARVKDDPVLPDARNHLVLHETPTAIFEVTQAGKPATIPWKDGQPAPAQLASVAVLDTKCARAYTDQEGELIFAPWGLDIVENLARVVFPTLTEGVKVELAACNSSDAAFADLRLANTAVATFLGKLSHQTTDELAEQAAAFSVEDGARLEVLNAALAEKSPAERAMALRAQATRLRTLITTLRDAATAVSDAEIARLRAVDREVVAALQAEQTAAAKLRGDGQLLGGSGEAAWEALYSAALAFLAQYEHKVELGAPCPLCQTPFDEAALERMGRFAVFVADRASAHATAQRSLLQQEVTSLQTRDFDPNLDGTTLAALAIVDEGWDARRTAFVAQLQSRRDWMLQALTSSHDWTQPPAVTADVFGLATELADQHDAEATAFEAIQDPAAKAKLDSERAELHARQQLSARLEALLALVAAKRKAHALEACLLQLKTKPISDKAGVLASGAVTQQLGDALNREFERLGVSHLHTSLKARNDKGKTKVKLVLDLPGFQKPEQILSEGEQRVIAIASFFAELNATGHRGAAVFDDPVSSLDHRRRQNVARRLVAEAANRQVIVFTHDTIFLAELMTAVELTPVPHDFSHLTYSQVHAGVVNEGLPWHHRRTSDRIDALEKLSKRFETDEPTMNSDQLELAARSVYGKLRAVIERGVEEVIFAGVLQRYNDYVRVPNITDTVGLSAEECEPLVRLYKRAGDVLDGHDKSGARGLPMPTAANFKVDVADLRAALDAIRARRKAAKTAT